MFLVFDALLRHAAAVLVLCGQLIEKKQYGVDGDPTIDYTKPLPFPFSSRPRLPTRLFVRNNVRRVLKPLLKELSTSYWHVAARRVARHCATSF